MNAVAATAATRAPSFSVVICCYTLDRWDDIESAVASVASQAMPALETIVVVDHNDALLARATAAWAGDSVQVIPNTRQQGLSGARNTGLEAARGDVVAFLDDDARADSDWLAQLTAAYDDPSVLGVGGSSLATWATSRPGWFPAEFDWVVGCTYLGQPETRAHVRNVIGSNMSFRREVFEAVGDFRSDIGRIGTKPLGCEETELCIRAQVGIDGGRIVFEPRAVVHHHVPASRGRVGYFASRCFAEGQSKAMVSNIAGSRLGLATERSYVRSTLPRGVARALAAAARGEVSGLGRVAAIVSGLWITTAGYLAGIVALRTGRLKISGAAGRVDAGSRSADG
ncbi:MAG: glycosyltransferase [Chloroflexi bacterium]|nr:glycosyltransferase [Chloroflexota bacterium]